MTYDPNNPFQGQNPYAQQRKQASDAAQGAGAQSMDAITRRYAAMGNLNSGAYTNALAQSGRDTQAATEKAYGDIGAQENASNMQNQQFQQAQGQQKEEFGQQLGQQGSQFQQSQAQQAAQFGQQYGLAGQQLAQNQAQFAANQELEKQRIANDQKANEINAQMGQFQQGHSGGLFGGGGFLGLGMGSGSNVGGIIQTGGLSALFG